MSVITTIINVIAYIQDCRMINRIITRSMNERDKHAKGEAPAKGVAAYP